MSKWISVEDRLPEKGAVVLAFGTRSATTGQFQGIGSRPWFWYWKGNTIKRVTHWMPLPEPPEHGTSGCMDYGTQETHRGAFDALEDAWQKKGGLNT